MNVRAGSRCACSTDWSAATRRFAAIANAASLIIVDECSMVDEDLGRDLLSFGRPVLVLGDPAQLPPRDREAYWFEALRRAPVASPQANNQAAQLVSWLEKLGYEVDQFR